jgi:hypothetical protein
MMSARKLKEWATLDRENRGLKLRLGVAEREVERVRKMNVDLASKHCFESGKAEREQEWLRGVIDGLCAGLKYINGEH